MIEDQQSYESWVVVHHCTTDYEADIVRDRLDDAGIPAVVYTQRDHSFNLTIGDMAAVQVMAPPERADEAKAFLAAAPPTEAEITEAAMDADPTVEDRYNPEQEAMLDSGIESIRLSMPDPADDDDAQQ